MKLYSGVNLIILLLTVTSKNSAGNCVNSECSAAYMDAAMDMIKKAKDHFPKELGRNLQPRDCTDILNLGNRASGIYQVWPQNRIMKGKPIDVYCDMETDDGGWTVIQRRGDFKREVAYFYKDWESYKNGFGDLDKDFWLGNDNIFAISNQKEYTARFDLTDVTGSTRYAKYDYFWIDDEYHQYMLHIKDYSGDAGDSMYPKHNEQKFSTKDRRNDNRNSTESCAVSFKGAWWYNACHDSNLNGFYLRGAHDSHANGVNWKSWKGHKESLLKTEIKLKPRDTRSVYSKSASNAKPEESFKIPESKDEPLSWNW